jgi:hypothetical protein
MKRRKRPVTYLQNKNKENSMDFNVILKKSRDGESSQQSLTEPQTGYEASSQFFGEPSGLISQNPQSSNNSTLKNAISYVDQGPSTSNGMGLESQFSSALINQQYDCQQPTKSIHDNAQQVQSSTLTVVHSENQSVENQSIFSAPTDTEIPSYYLINPLLNGQQSPEPSVPTTIDPNMHLETLTNILTELQNVNKNLQVLYEVTLQFIKRMQTPPTGSNNIQQYVSTPENTSEEFIPENNLRSVEELQALNNKLKDGIYMNKMVSSLNMYLIFNIILYNYV